MFGPTPFSPLNTPNSYAGSLGARSTKKDPEDDIEHPEPPPIWKQVATIVALHGLIATVETLGRRLIHRLFDGPEGPKAEGSQPMIMMLAPDEEHKDEKEDKEESE
jgi:hypothetical protein